MSGFERLLAGRLPRLVMFDLDGTLVDSVPDLAAAVDEMLLSLGRPLAGREQVRNWVGNGARVLVRRALAGDLQLSGQGQWVGSRLHFRGEASASPEREAALSNLLNILGRRQGARSIITFG